MDRRRAVLCLAGAAASGWAVLAPAQSARRVYRVGFLGTASASGYVREVEWIREGLRKLGYAEGRNLAIEYRWAEGSDERMRAIAAEFVALKVDAILTHNSIGALAAMGVTTTVPVVMADGGDPVASGIAKSLARPGRNATGSISFVAEEAAKRLELLKDVLARVRRVAFLSTAGFPPYAMAPVRQALQAAALSAKIDLHDFTVRDAQELPEAFRAVAAAGMQAIVVNNEPSLNAHATVVGALASAARLPAVGYASFADAGGLLGYGANRPALYGRAGHFLDRIFKGANPGDIPFERASKWDVVINLRTAQALGVTVPEAVRLRADRVIQP